MKKIVTIFISSLLVLNMYSQVINRCSSMDVLYQDELNDPSLAANILVQQQLQDQWMQQNPDGGSRSVVTIPVVVHVVYNTTTQNISDAQIQSQIAVLNQDYARLNPDSVNTPSCWTTVAGGTNIRFTLAVRDPNGNSTNGIERIHITSNTSFSTNDQVKKSSTGGADGWDRNSYLNLWVCNLGGGVLGYSSFPGGQAWKDGVVISYKYFGTIGSATNPYDLGRTATHEIGHWLGLYHIWGDDNGACSGSDNITDTPNQASENYGCPNFPHVSCSNGPNGDMFCNYMDYTDDNCMNMFTDKQVLKMQSTISTTRSSILTSLGGAPVGIQDISFENGISIYPNPTSNSASFYFADKSLNNITVNVYSVTGVLIKSMIIQTNDALDVTDLNSGVYYLSFSNGTFEIMKKLVIEH